MPGGLALTAGVVLVLAPWTVRNARQFGQFQPLNPRSVAMPGEFVAYGYARWVRTWIDHPRYVPSALFTVDLAPIRIDEMPAYAFGSEAERRRVAALLADYNRPAPDADPDEDGRLPPGGMTPAIDAGFDRLARERIAAHPLRYYVLLPARRAFSLWFDTHADFYPFAGYLLPVSGWNREEAQQVWLPIFAVLMAAWTVAGWAGAWRLGRHADTRMWLVLAVLLIVPRLALLSALENPEPGTRWSSFRSSQHSRRFMRAGLAEALHSRGLVPGAHRLLPAGKYNPLPTAAPCTAVRCPDSPMAHSSDLDLTASEREALGRAALDWVLPLVRSLRRAPTLP